MDGRVRPARVDRPADRASRRGGGSTTTRRSATSRVKAAETLLWPMARVRESRSGRSSSPRSPGDYPTPPTAPLIQHRLGLRDAGCFDLGRGVRGFRHGPVHGRRVLRAPPARRSWWSRRTSDRSSSTRATRRPPCSSATAPPPASSAGTARLARSGSWQASCCRTAAWPTSCAWRPADRACPVTGRATPSRHSCG